MKLPAPLYYRHLSAFVNKPTWRVPLCVSSFVWPSSSTAHCCQHLRPARVPQPPWSVHATTHLRQSAFYPVHPGVKWLIHSHSQLPSRLLWEFLHRTIQRLRDLKHVWRTLPSRSVEGFAPRIFSLHLLYSKPHGAMMPLGHRQAILRTLWPPLVPLLRVEIFILMTPQ